MKLRAIRQRFQWIPRPVRQAIVLVIGGLVVIIGAVMIVAPGPAFIVIPLGLAILAIEFSRINPGFFMSFGAWVGLAGGAIMAKGTVAQKKRWALPILLMDTIGAWGMTEPGAGSDAFGSRGSRRHGFRSRRRSRLRTRIALRPDLDPLACGRRRAGPAFRHAASSGIR